MSGGTLQLYGSLNLDLGASGEGVSRDHANAFAAGGLRIGGRYLDLRLPSPRAEEPVSFVKDIQPIFEQSCWSCHSQTLQLSKLDLSSRDSALKGASTDRRSIPDGPPTAGCTV